MNNQSVANLFGYLSNEARNAMHAIVGLMEMRADEPRDPPERASLDICRASADRLLRSIDDVQALFSEEPPAPSAPQAFDLQTVLDEAIELLNLSASETPSRLVLKTHQTVPIPVSDDRRTVEVMLTRLLDSALKLTSRGEVRVALCNEQKEISLDLALPDSGSIRQLANWLNANPSEIRLDGATPVLTTVNAMVAGKWIRARKGTVRMLPNPQVPASLSISLQLQQDVLAPEPIQRPNELRTVLNILVVEDCDESYALAELLLKNERLWRASDGAEAIDMVKRRRFDVVFMDVHLPGTDGYGAIRAIRNWETETGNARTPMVVLSADDIGTQVRSASESGCSGFLRKPVRRAEISAVLERLKAVQHSIA